MKPIISNYDVFADGESVGVLENGDWLQLVAASGSRHHYRLSSVTYVGFRSRRTDSLLMIASVLFLIAAAIALLLGNAGLVMSGRSDFLTYVIAVLFFCHWVLFSHGRSVSECAWSCNLGMCRF